MMLLFDLNVIGVYRIKKNIMKFVFRNKKDCIVD